MGNKAVEAKKGGLLKSLPGYPESGDDTTPRNEVIMGLDLDSKSANPLDCLRSHTTKAFLYECVFGVSVVGVVLLSIFTKMLSKQSEQDDDVKTKMYFTIAGLIISVVSMGYTYRGANKHIELAKKESLYALRSVYLAVESILSAVAAVISIRYFKSSDFFDYVISLFGAVAAVVSTFGRAIEANKKAVLAPPEDSNRLQFSFKKAYAVGFATLAFSGGFLASYLNNLKQGCQQSNCKSYELRYEIGVILTAISMLVMFSIAAVFNMEADEIVAESSSHAFKSLAAGTDAFISIGATAGLIYFATYLYSVIKADSCDNCTKIVFVGFGIDASLLIMFFAMYVAAKQLAVANKEYLAAQPVDQRETSTCSKMQSVLTAKPSKVLVGSAGVVGSVFLIKDLFVPLFLSDESSRSNPLFLGAILGGVGAMYSGLLSCYSMRSVFHTRCAIFSTRRTVALTNAEESLEASQKNTMSKNL